MSVSTYPTHWNNSCILLIRACSKSFLIQMHPNIKFTLTRLKEKLDKLDMMGCSRVSTSESKLTGVPKLFFTSTNSNFHPPVQQNAALWSPALMESRAVTPARWDRTCMRSVKKRSDFDVTISTLANIDNLKYVWIDDLLGTSLVYTFVVSVTVCVTPYVLF